MMKRFQVQGNNGGSRVGGTDIPNDLGVEVLGESLAAEDTARAHDTRDALYAVHPNSDHPDLEAFNQASRLIGQFPHDDSHILYTNDQGQQVTVGRLRHAYAEVAVRLVENSHLSAEQRTAVRNQFAAQRFLTDTNIQKFDAKVAQANSASGAGAQGSLAGLEARRPTTARSSGSSHAPHAPEISDYRAAIERLETAQGSGVAMSTDQFNEANTLSLLLQGLAQNGVYPVGSQGYRQLQGLIARAQTIVNNGSVPVTSHPLPQAAPAAAPAPTFAVAGASTVTTSAVAAPHGRAYQPATDAALHAAMDATLGADPTPVAQPAENPNHVDMVFAQETPAPIPEERAVTNYRQVMASVEDTMSRIREFRSEHPGSAINPNDVTLVNTSLDSALRYLQGYADSDSLHRLDVATPYSTVQTNAGALRAEVAAIRATLQRYVESR